MNDEWIKTLEYRPETPVEAQAPNPENPTSNLALRRMTLRTTKILHKRPDPPREVLSKNGRLSWKPPKDVRGEPKVTHYNIYQNNELNRVRQVPSDQLFLEDNLEADRVYVSAWNDTMQIESIKVLVLWEGGSGGGGGDGSGGGLVVGFVICNGSVGTDVGPLLAAPGDGEVEQCVVVVKASDVATGLEFLIRKNGISVFSANPTVAAGAAIGTLLTFPLSTTTVAVDLHDVFSMDIVQGTAAWKFTAQLE